MARVIFMGTPEFAVPSLQTLIETQQVVGVVTQPDKPSGRGNVLRPSPVKMLAQSAGIPIYQPRSLKQEESVEPLRAWRPDVIIVTAFGQILRPHVLDLPPAGCINVHASLLPRWRGASPIQHTILAGDPASGITLMKMNEGLDTGPIFLRESLPIEPRETAASLHDRLAALGAKLLRLHLDDILAGKIPAVPQDDDESTYAPMIHKEAGRIDWRQHSLTIDRLIRAMSPWPTAYTHWQGELLKILSARPVVEEIPIGEPGTVVEMDDAVAVLTGDGALLLEQVQLAGKRTMSIADFLRGRPEFLGAVLGDHASFDHSNR
ncbi:MAG: methionyl-tRNA formyltransferase [Chloroflexota bacterium]